MLNPEQSFEVYEAITSLFSEAPKVMVEIERLNRVKARLINNGADTLEETNAELALIRQDMDRIATGEEFVCMILGGSGVMRALIDFDAENMQYGVRQLDGRSSLDIGQDRRIISIPEAR